MKIDVLSVVTRGAKAGTRECDICGRHAAVLRECHIRYYADSTHVAHGFWYDLCRSCIDDVRAAPDLPADSEKARSARDRAKQRVRDRSANVG